MLYVCPFPGEGRAHGWSHYFGIIHVPGTWCIQEQEKLNSCVSALPWFKRDHLPWHGEVLPGASFSFWFWHPGLCCQEAPCSQQLASRNGKNANCFWDCWKEGQGGFRATDIGMVGYSSQKPGGLEKLAAEQHCAQLPLGWSPQDPCFQCSGQILEWHCIRRPQQAKQINQSMEQTTKKSKFCL